MTATRILSLRAPAVSPPRRPTCRRSRGTSFPAVAIDSREIQGASMNPIFTTVDLREKRDIDHLAISGRLARGAIAPITCRRVADPAVETTAYCPARRRCLLSNIAEAPHANACAEYAWSIKTRSSTEMKICVGRTIEGARGGNRSQARCASRRSSSSWRHLRRSAVSSRESAAGVIFGNRSERSTALRSRQGGTARSTGEGHQGAQGARLVVRSTSVLPAR